MKSLYIIKCCIGLCLLVLTGCQADIKLTGQIDTLPTIYPDYQGVTIPPNIAPLNFEVVTEEEGEWGLLIQTTEQTYSVYAEERLFVFEEVAEAEKVTEEVAVAKEVAEVVAKVRRK